MWIKFNRDNGVVYRHIGELSSKVVSIEDLGSGRHQSDVSARFICLNDGRSILNVCQKDGRQEEYEVNTLEEATTLLGIIWE